MVALELAPMFTVAFGAVTFTTAVPDTFAVAPHPRVSVSEAPLTVSVVSGACWTAFLGPTIVPPAASLAEIVRLLPVVVSLPSVPHVEVAAPMMICVSIGSPPTEQESVLTPIPVVVTQLLAPRLILSPPPVTPAWPLAARLMIEFDAPMRSPDPDTVYVRVPLVPLND